MHQENYAAQERSSAFRGNTADDGAQAERRRYRRGRSLQIAQPTHWRSECWADSFRGGWYPVT